MKTNLTLLSTAGCLLTIGLAFPGAGAAADAPSPSVDSGVQRDPVKDLGGELILMPTGYDGCKYGPMGTIFCSR